MASSCESRPASAGAPLIESVVVQPTPFCNINCRYCYLPQRDDRSTMELATIETLFSKVFASGWTDERLTIIWHAGEPLVLPPSYYETAFERIEALRPEGLELRHAFQTNGMLISPEWCDLFRRWDVGVGVSIDGPREIHDANRVTRSGRGTFDKTIAGVRLLRAENIPFHVISVVSQRSMASPQALLDFYLDEGIEDVCFNVEESEGDHNSELFSAADADLQFRAFLKTFWELARESGRIRFIREIDDMVLRIFRPEEAEMRNAQVEPFGMINVACNGAVSSFSPELLGYRNAEYGDFIVGNILTDSLQSMLAGEAMSAMYRDISAGVGLCRKTCEYFSVCGGGAPVNKLTENGGFASGATQFCRLTQMAPTDLVIDAFDRLERAVEGGRDPAVEASRPPVSAA